MEIPASLSEYVEAQDRLEREARELFPYDFSSCSYHERGYVKQQVFACKTCDPDDGEPRGGCCYSCSITCHGDHELIELFNRRAFRCDCGTPRMGKDLCSIRKERQSVNPENQYNDNYENIFCYCKTTYDHETEEGTMYQCLLCEDWFHDRCIAEKDQLPEDPDDFEYYLCRDCVHKQPWLCRYANSPSFCCQTDPGLVQSSTKTSSHKALPLKKRAAQADEVHVDGPPTSRIKREDGSDKEGGTEDKSPPSTTTCLWKSLPEDAFLHDKSLFLTENFRDCLCRCPDCLSVRLDAVPAIATEEEVYDPPRDTDSDTGTAESLYDAGTRAMTSTLASMPREKAIESILAFNKLKDHITACLKPLADRGQIVTKEDVQEFFNQRK